jgi:branched-chain amino acid transport system substrate-binding protein
MIFFDDPLVGNNSKKDNLFDKYREEYGKKPDFEFAVSASYDVIYILNNSLARCSENTDCIKEYLYNTRFEGALGNFSFDENGDLFGVKPSVKQIRDNKPVLIN